MQAWQVWNETNPDDSFMLFDSPTYPRLWVLEHLVGGVWNRNDDSVTYTRRSDGARVVLRPVDPHLVG